MTISTNGLQLWIEHGLWIIDGLQKFKKGHRQQKMTLWTNRLQLWIEHGLQGLQMDFKKLRGSWAPNA